MNIHSIDAGSKYPFTFRDADGDLLDGSNHYILRIPPDPPAELFWAVTAYNTTDGTMPETDQLLPSINQFNTVKYDDDGAIRLYFGLTLRDGTPASNYIKTIPGRAFMAVIRFFGPAVEFFEQTWKPDDVIKAS